MWASAVACVYAVVPCFTYGVVGCAASLSLLTFFVWITQTIMIEIKKSTVMENPFASINLILHLCKHRQKKAP
jgi:hypothetical protein